MTSPSRPNIAGDRALALGTATRYFIFFPLKYELQAEARGFGEWLSLCTKKLLSWAMRSLRVNYVNCNEDFRVYFTGQQK